MATMRDVAKRAEVSISTVSYVLSGERAIGQETRERVMEAVQVLGYRVNGVARSLKTGRNLSLGLIIPDILNPFFTAVAQGVEDTAVAGGYNVILCNSGSDVRREEGYLELLPSRRVDGVIYMPGTAVPHPQIRSLAEHGFPVVVIDESVEGVPVPSVVVQNREGAMAIGEHLVDLGHRRVDIIGGPADLRTARERVGGLIESLERQGAVVGRIVTGDYRMESGEAAMRTLLDSDERSTAVFAANDMMAIGAIREVRRHGIDVPGELSIAGFDDIPLASLVSPALATVRQPARQMGEVAASLLLSLLSGQEPEPVGVLDTQLEIRDSTAAPPALPGKH